MGWFSGNYRDVNRRAFGRMDESLGLMDNIRALGSEYRTTAQGIIKELTTQQMGEASKAREGAIAAANTRNRQALERGLAASSDPLDQAAVAGEAGADRSVTEKIRMHGKIKQGILQRETEQNLTAEKVATATEVAGALGKGDVLGSADEQVTTGYGDEVMTILGMVAGANMDKIMGMFKGKGPDRYGVEMPTDPAIEHERQMKAGLDHVKPTEVRGVDIPMSENVTGPKPAAPEVQPTNLLENLGMESMGKSQTSLFHELRRKRLRKEAIRLGLTSGDIY